MLDDRYYMRRTPFDSRRSATVILIVINIVVFFVQLAAARFPNFPLDRYFALSLAGLKHGYAWQLLSYQFMHGNLLHLLFNCWAIFVFGREVEEVLGLKHFLTLYFSSGILGGLVQALVGLLLGGVFAAPVVGASAAAFGLVAAFALLFPDRQLLLFFFIPVRAKYLLLLCGLLAAFGLLSRGDGIAHAAHLGGMLAGIVFVRYAVHWTWHWPRLRRSSGQTPRRLVRVGSSSSGAWGRDKDQPSEELPPEEFVSREVDPILDKISAHGIQSLTPRERRVLEAAREKMAKR